MDKPYSNTKRIQEIYRDLLHTCKPFMKKEEQNKLREAFELVMEFHKPEWESTGEKELNHVVEIAKIVLKELNLGATSVICALLHNVVDYKTFTIEKISDRFGEEAAIIVEGFTKLSEIKTEKISVQSESFRRLYLSLVKDFRVILIKLAHRLYDMRNFENLSDAKQTKSLLEVNHIYIPIAHRLGLYNLKTELEELWMLHTNPVIYKGLHEKVKETSAKQKVYIDDVIHPIEKELLRHNFSYEIKGRPKSIHSIWRKMREQNVEFEEVYDLFAIRIIIDSDLKKEKADCWRVYSLVTDIYPPNPKRLRDWISTPKSSGYESLHTTVVGPGGRWVEIQIRSKRMDILAEQGLAAHWKYKEGVAKEEQENWMNRIREVIDSPDLHDNNESELSKIELYSDKIFIFTPEGDLKTLPSGSTVLDFAYEIHSSVGDMCSGARVNNKIVPIRHVLQNGDKVEIITSKNQKPKLDWLNFAVTSKAKSKIKRAIKEEKFQEAEIGKEMLRRKLRNRKIQFSDTIIDKLIKQYKLKSSVDLYYLIAIEKIDLSEIKKKIVQNEGLAAKPAETEPVEVGQKELKPKPVYDRDFTFSDKSIEHLGYELAKCCNPISGDAVFGFVTVGKGITIHRINCPNARQLISKYNYRVIDVKWSKTDEERSYITTIRVVGNDEIGIVNKVTDVISKDFKVNMVSLDVIATKNGKFDGRFKVKVRDTGHLDMLIFKIQKIKGVKKAARLDSGD